MTEFLSLGKLSILW